MILGAYLKTVKNRIVLIDCQNILSIILNILFIIINFLQESNKALYLPNKSKIMNLRPLTRKPILLVILSLLALFVLLYNLKSPVFRWILAKKVESVQEKYGVTVSYNRARVNGISTIEISNLIISPSTDTSLVEISKFTLRLPISSLLTFKLKPAYVGIDSLFINLNPLTRLVDKRAKSIEVNLHDSSSIDYFSKQRFLTSNNLYRALKGIFILTATRFEINGFTTSYSNSNHNTKITSDKFSSWKGNINSTIRVEENGNTRFISVIGNTNNNDNSIRINIENPDSLVVTIPIIDDLLGLHCEFQSACLDLTIEELKSNSISFNSYAFSSGLKLRHPLLSDKEVSFERTELSLSAKLKPSFLSIDSTSFIGINSLRIPISLDFDSRESNQLKLKIHTESIEARSIFESLPIGLFPTLRGIKVSGLANFDLWVDVDFNNPENLEFQSKLTPQNLKLLSFGQVDFTMLNDSFTYNIYNNDSIVKSILLHPSNKGFWPLYSISPYLRHAVVVAEDGGFYHHKGFDPDGFRFALSRNIKDRRLARGGSTITMQLVKNLYLNRNKTLTRKAEEALIVWLIETQKLVEKDRILEIYLNIIDWGPNINGIGEAAEFYFNTTPDKLELNEAIFLASIIPRPNLFMHSFDVFGNLRDYYNGYFNFVSGTMRDRGLITDEDFDNLVPFVNLNGPARVYLKSNALIEEEGVADW